MKQNNKNALIIIKLIDKNYVQKDLILEKLKIKESTFHKQLAQLKKAGFRILRKKDSYMLTFFKNILKLQDFEKEILAYMLAISCISLSERKIADFKNIIEKILYLTDEKTYNDVIEKFNIYKSDLIENFYIEKIRTIQKYIDKKGILRIVLTSGKECILKPLEFEYGKEKLFLNCLDIKNKETKKIAVMKIVKVSLYSNDIRTINEKRETIFELYNNLAKTYLLKEEERIIDKNKNKIVVANSASDKRILFQRLLRYDKFAKVILPIQDVDSFKELIKESIHNINNTNVY